MHFPEALSRLFNELDMDNSGTINAAELKMALEQHSGKRMREEDVKKFLATLDAHKDGELSREELNKMFS
ncbi:unnamed protein product [Dibothriocephalus latus]|uniref:EF-hand domain-containing protein n=1 Tax=Dibothriocephalus latus TaxID=60516 RepID=A0A3P7P4Q9_DIBLA|nr:unnamed protein product [Dibothriocephalus latus]